MGASGMGGIVSIIWIAYLAIIGLGLYTTFLFIKALKIYIKKNS